MVEPRETLLDELLLGLVRYILLILSVLPLEPSSYLVSLVRLGHLHILETNQVIRVLHVARYEVVRVKVVHTSRLIILRVNLAHEILELIVLRQTVVVRAIGLLQVINLLTRQLPKSVLLLLAVDLRGVVLVFLLLLHNILIPRLTL